MTAIFGRQLWWGRLHPDEPLAGSGPCFRSAVPFPIVALGASAGGLDAFTQFLGHLPVDTGMAFVLVQHLDPSHPSVLGDLLAKSTAMPVHAVTQDLAVAPNTVYVIPPNCELRIEGGLLKLEPPGPRGQGVRRSIDIFFESLAQEQQERAIAIVLSGTASDGTLGLEAIKAEGGITFAQDSSAKFDAMPRNAIAAGCVDFVLSPAAMAQELARIARHPYVAAPPRPAGETARVPAGPRAQTGEEAGAPTALAAPAFAVTAAPTGPALRAILQFVARRSGVDFSPFRPASLGRRILRRMALHQLVSIADYTDLLGRDGAECEALYNELLIGVTSFFRNPEVFDHLRDQVFPQLAAGRPDEPLRVWTAGCSTGQEVYSLAMAYAEYADRDPQAPPLQVFGTDLHLGHLQQARTGFYPRALVNDLTAERLRRFFVEENGGYRIRRVLREGIVFARQNVLSDPPFSRLDLITCRNLLIYIEPDWQAKVMAAFHYGLRPHGWLLLGAAESVGTATDLFEPAEGLPKFYVRRNGPTPPAGWETGAAMREPAAAGWRPPRSPAPAADSAESRARRQAEQLLLAHPGAASVFTDPTGRILEARGAVDDYLTGGESAAADTVVARARPGLKPRLRAALPQVQRQGRSLAVAGIRLRGAEGSRQVRLEVHPLAAPDRPHFLILFADDPAPHSRPAAGSAAEAVPPALNAAGQPEERLATLERENAHLRAELRGLHARYATVRQELQAAHEETLSANEGMQSLVEEMETSAEELQSANEELTTINDEVRGRNTELSRLSSDLSNFQTAAHLAIVLLGPDLTIRRFSQEAQRQFNLRPGDVGRPFKHVRHNLVFAGERSSQTAAPDLTAAEALVDLGQLLTDVIAQQQEREREVRDQAGRWYALRLRPAQTAEGQPDGAILVLVDIDLLKRAGLPPPAARRAPNGAPDRALGEILEWQALVFDSVRDHAILTLDLDNRITTWNQGARRIFGYAPAEIIGQAGVVLFTPEDRSAGVPEREVENAGRFGHAADERWHLRHDGSLIFLSGEMCPIRTAAGELRGFTKVARDLTERRRATEALQESEAKFRVITNTLPQLIWTAHPDGFVDYYNERWYEYTGTERGIFGDASWEPVVHPGDRSRTAATYAASIRAGQPYQLEIRLRDAAGHFRWFMSQAVPVRNDAGAIVKWLGASTDIEEQKQAEERLEAAVARRTMELRASNQQLETFVYSIAHDLRGPLRAMQGFSAILVDEGGDALGAVGRDYAQRISRSAQLMDALLRDLLAFSRASQLRPELGPVPLEAAVQTALAHLEPQIQEKHAEVRLLGPWPVVLAHEATLAQVLVNLIGNALKFVRPGVTPEVRIRAEPHAAPAPDPAGEGGPESRPVSSRGWRVWVEDNGIGIAPEHREQIFRLFARLHGQKYQGTGLGLAIVEKAVERLGGRVGVESAPGAGSRFWIELREA